MDVNAKLSGRKEITHGCFLAAREEEVHRESGTNRAERLAARLQSFRDIAQDLRPDGSRFPGVRITLAAVAQKTATCRRSGSGALVGPDEMQVQTELAAIPDTLESCCHPVGTHGVMTERGRKEAIGDAKTFLKQRKTGAQL
ncbi:hypothetical protein GQ651_08755 [Alphaproteobacteria bacterium GH1-50]|uniref:Uncharacterized protein n=1 Tax=Kangsaoukella pontilimi TaxID=2691042 RepID=A0A7C9MWV8_9RHOB|nr:hypothetical protein [Kangsaoukella pontilimi]MXQ07934.1 hypothetical protein [Kangsaoukella pontilimi]